MLLAVLLTAVPASAQITNTQVVDIKIGSATGANTKFNTNALIYNFGITTSGGFDYLMTNMLFQMDRGTGVNNTNKDVFVQVYNGFGGTGSIILSNRINYTNVGTAFAMVNLLLGTNLVVGPGSYSVRLTSGSSGSGSDTYQFKLGALQLTDTNGTSLPVLQWVEDTDPNGTATTNLVTTNPILADFAINTNNVNFGNYRIGSTLSSNVVLTNNGFATTNNFTGSLLAAATTSNAATVSGVTTNAIAQGQTDPFTVGLVTTNVGTNTGTVRLNYQSATNGTAISNRATWPTNIGSQTVTVSGVGYRLADDAVNTTNVNLGNFRVVNGPGTGTVTITNTSTNDGFSEGLGVTNAGTSGSATVTNIPGGLVAARGTTNVTVGLNTSNAGTNSGTVSLGFNSSGVGTSGFAATNIGTTNINVTAVGYRLADDALNTTNVNLGNFRIVDGAGTGTVTVTNNATADGFSEGLGITNAGTSGATVTNLPGGLVNAGGSANMTVGLSTANAGTNSGSVTLGFNSSGVGTSGFAPTNIGSQVVNVTGVGYRLADDAVSTTNVNLGNFRIVDGAGTGSVTISNTATADGFSEGLAVSNDGTSGATVTNVPGGLIAAGATANVTVGLGTANAGTNNGTVTLGFNSDGAGTSGFGATNVGSQVVNVTGVGYRLANEAVSTANLSLGRFHIGYNTNMGSLSGTVGITNTATADGFSEGLAVANDGTSGGATVSGLPGSLVAAGANANFTLGLGSVSSVGTNSGSVTLGFQSSGTGTSGFAATNIGTQVVTVTAQGYSGQAFWNVNGSGSWNDFDNWDVPGGTPGIDGVLLSTNDQATFGNVISTARTVSLNGQSPVLTLLAFSNASSSYTIAQGSGGSITMGTESAAQTTITNGAGEHTVATAIALARATQVGVATNSKLSVSAINGTNNLGKSGTGTLSITGNGNLSGSTAVTGGTLNVNGSISNSAVTVSTGATLSGSGTVGETSLANGATISPGNSPGTLNILGDVNWSGGANYNWQILDAATNNAPGSTWDFISATGALDLQFLSSSNRFNINLWTLSSTSPDVSGLAANFNNTQSYRWTILTAAGGITGGFDTNKFNVNLAAINGTDGWANDLGGGNIFVDVQGNNLDLVFNPNIGPQPVPEPGTWAAAALLLGAAGYVRWRKRKA